MNDATPHILLVEDNLAHALLLSRSLGCVAGAPASDHVTDGEAAIYWLNAQQARGDLPALVFLDLRLPKVDGFEVLRHIKGTDALAGIPVVMLSTSDREEDIRQARTYGASHYLVKPCSCETLEEVLTDLSILRPVPVTLGEERFGVRVSA